MTRTIRNLSILLFLLSALATGGQVPLQAQVDCYEFFNYCDVEPQSTPNFYRFFCSPEVTCSEAQACISDACTPGGSVCTEPGAPYGGAIGSFVCYPQ